MSVAKSYFLGKTAWITGGSQGIGEATACLLAQAGANVVICSRSEEKLQTAMKKIQVFRIPDSQQKIGSFKVDVTNPTDVNQTYKNALSDYGLPDLLIHSAGMAYSGFIENSTMDEFRTMMDLNYFGTVHSCKAILPHWLEKKHSGHIVNISSMAGFIGLFGFTGYCATKYAVMGFSEALRAELKPNGIRVSVLCPPATQTPGLDEENKTKPKEVRAVEEKAKPLSAEAVAQVLLDGVIKNKFIIVPGFEGKLAFQLSRHAPKILEQFTKRPV